MKTAQVEVQKNNINKSVFTNQALLKNIRFTSSAFQYSLCEAIPV